MKENKIVEKIIAGINKNVREKQWKCLISGCEEKSINSHILQKNGVLNQIAPNGFIYELKPKDVFKWIGLEFKTLKCFKKISTNQAHSYPTFCNIHDTSLFKTIESHPIDFNNYQNHLLFAFRVLVSFMRKEEIVLEKEERLFNSKTLKANPNCKESLAITKQNIDLHKYLLKIRNKEYELFINDINTNGRKFTFIELTYPLKEVYASSIISSPNFNSIYVNIFPYNSTTKVLFLFYTDSRDQWTTEFIENWKDLNEFEFELKLTTFLLTKCENWGMSEKLFENVNSNVKNKIIEITQDFAVKRQGLYDNKFLLDFSIF